MKRFLLTMLMCSFVFFSWPGSMIAEVTNDPTGTMQKIYELNEAHSKAIETLVGSVRLDYHPEFGTIRPEDYPVNAVPINPEEVKAQFVNEMEGKGYVITELTMTEATLSGRVLVEHRVSNQNIFVWHELQNANVNVINAQLNQGGLCYRMVRVWIQTCTNGAGYWDWQYLWVPCDSYNYSVNYYSNDGGLTPYPMHEWPTPPPIDPTGTFQRIHELNVAHRAQIDGILSKVNVDEHPVYGCIQAEDFPVNPNGTTMDEMNAMIIAETSEVILLDSKVENVTVSGKVLSEHMIDGVQAWVWHEYINTPVAYATAMVQDLNSSSNLPYPQYNCWEWRWVKVWVCNNGLGIPGYWKWEWRKVRVPCYGQIDHLQIKYHIENVGHLESIL